MSGYLNEFGEWIEVEEEDKPSLWSNIKKSQVVAKQEKPKVAKQVKQVAKHSCNPKWTSKTAKEYGRLGGVLRAKKLSPEERQEIARKAAHARWAKAPKRGMKIKFIGDMKP